MKYLLATLLFYTSFLIASPLPGIPATEPKNEQPPVVAQLSTESSLVKTRASRWQEFTFWVMQKQQEYHRSLSAKIEALNEQQTLQNTWLLLLLSFLYGVFHAAGPGHGKSVLTTYLLTQPEKLRQGVQLSFMAAMLQGITAILLVAFLVHGLGWLAKEALASVVYIEAASFLLVTLLGLLLVLRGIKQLLPVKPSLQFKPLKSATSVSSSHAPVSLQLSSTSLASSACSHCGKAHHVTPEQLSGGSRLQNLSLVFSIGLRPCSGAVLVLVATNLLGLWWVGVLATLAMALGTALTVAFLAILAVKARLLAKRLIKLQSKALTRLSALLVVLGGCFILMLGVSLLVESLASSGTRSLF